MEKKEQQVCLSPLSGQYLIAAVLFSGGSDYTIDVTELIFTAGSNLRECTTLVANDDLALENSEVLTLFLTTDVIHNMQPISVTIMDNDSALLVPHLIQCILFAICSW